MKGNTKNSNVKLTELEEQICRFDAILDHIQKLMPEDMRVYDYIVQIRDALFRLQQAMRGCEIVEFACSGLDDVVTTTTISPADIFWNRGEEEDTEYYGEGV